MATKTADDKDTTTAAPEAPEESPKASKRDVPAAGGGIGEFAAFARSANAATGDVFHVPDSPAELAKRGTKLGLAGDHSTGGFNDPLANPGRSPQAAPAMARVWAMDNDHTTANRGSFDPLKPDCSVEA